MSTKKYTVDFRKVKYYFDMHFTIRDSLEFPDYYGCNWSAFWDCLTDMYGDLIAEESRTHAGFKRYFCPSLRCPSSEYDSTPSLDAP